MDSFDVVIAGGGPAGSTVAALLKKYAPHLRVLLLERTIFPRHHIGESMLAGTTPVLVEMEVYDKIEGHGFIEKLGATFVWGQDRRHWGFEFGSILAHLAATGQSLPAHYTKAWQVRRAEYDHILLDHAAEMGAEVRQGARVRHPLLDEATNRVVGVAYSDETGDHQVASAAFVDCTGQDGLLGRFLDLRDYDPRMNNYALYGYWRGARWKFDYLGYPHLTRIFIATTPRGWIWYIPVAADIVSVGFVTHRQTLAPAAGQTDRLYRDELLACEEISGLLDGAAMVRLSPDQPRDVMAIQDWSYTSRQMAGPGWALCGDAAGFVDPVLSSGAMLAHELGQKAAYTLNSMFRANSDTQIDAYWRFYDETYRTNLNAYRDMAAFWYGNNFSMESWWWQARRALFQETGANLNDPEAFIRLAAGYGTRSESLSLFGSYPLHEALDLVTGLFGSAADLAQAAAAYGATPPQLHPRARLTQGFYYFQGEIRKTGRVIAPDRQRYLDLHPGEEVLLRLLDGRHTLDEINRSAQEMRAMQERMPLRTGTELVVQLAEIGGLA